MRVKFEAFDQQEVYWGHLRYQLIEGRFWVAAQCVLQSPAASRSDHDFASSGLSVAPRILTWLIEIEGVVCMLDGRHRDPAGDQFGNDCRHQRRLAAAAPSGKTKNPHRQPPVSILRP